MLRCQTCSQTWETNGKTGKLGSEGSRFRWEAVMFLFNVVNLNVWLFFFDNFAKCFVEVVAVGSWDWCLVPSALLSASSTRTSFYWCADAQKRSRLHLQKLRPALHSAQDLWTFVRWQQLHSKGHVVYQHTTIDEMKIDLPYENSHSHSHFYQDYDRFSTNFLEEFTPYGPRKSQPWVKSLRP